MTPIEAKAFLAVLDIAAAAAQAIRSAPGYRMVRDGFAVEALAALAEEGRALLLADPDAGPVTDAPVRDKLGGGGNAVAPIPAAAE